MRYLGISSATAVYSAAGSCRIHRHRISHQTFKDFSIALSRFLRQVEPDDDFWLGIVRTLRRYSFTLMSASLPFSHPDVLPPEALRTCAAQLGNCELLYPQLSARARDLIARATALAECKDNPLLDAITSMFPEDSNSAVIVREARLIPAVERVVSVHPQLRGLKVVSPAELRGPVLCKRLFLLGPARWLPEYVLSAPRSERIDVIQYSWVADRPTVRRAFIGQQGGSNQARREGPLPQEAKSTGAAAASEVEVDAGDFLDRIDLDAVGQKASNEESPENVEALLYELEDGMGVYLEADDSASAIVIDAEETGKARVRRIACAEIEVGMYVLLRTAGGGDYIIPVADRIMGERAHLAREQQLAWKSRLRNKVRQIGPESACKELRKLGSRRAGALNLRNWMSERFIKTRDKEDFTAIARLVGLENEVDGIWHTMCLIDLAHKRAGQRIRKLLLKEVMASNLVELERRGRMGFELSEADGGSLTAFRIVRISERKFWVSPIRAGHPFLLEEGLWRE